MLHGTKYKTFKPGFKEEGVIVVDLCLSKTKVFITVFSNHWTQPLKILYMSLIWGSMPQVPISRLLDIYFLSMCLIVNICKNQGYTRWAVAHRFLVWQIHKYSLWTLLKEFAEKFQYFWLSLFKKKFLYSDGLTWLDIKLCM